MQKCESAGGGFWEGRGDACSRRQPFSFFFFFLFFFASLVLTRQQDLVQLDHVDVVEGALEHDFPQNPGLVHQRPALHHLQGHQPVPNVSRLVSHQVQLPLRAASELLDGHEALGRQAELRDLLVRLLPSKAPPHGASFTLPSSPRDAPVSSLVTDLDGCRMRLGDGAKKFPGISRNKNLSRKSRQLTRSGAKKVLGIHRGR